MVESEHKAEKRGATPGVALVALLARQDLQPGDVLAGPQPAVEEDEDENAHSA